MRLKFLIAAIAFALTGSAFGQQKSATSVKNERGFYNKNARGWFFYEKPVVMEEKEEEVPEDTETPPATEKSQTKKVKLNVEWLRENLDKFRDAAINNPTRENTARYLYTQRLMLDMASRFEKAMVQYSKGDMILDEDTRRPTTAIELSAFQQKKFKKIRSAINKMGEKAHLWFFYKSTCDFCKRQIAALNQFKKKFNMEILGVSMDGYQLPGMESWKHRIDRELVATKNMGVERTPTIIMMMNDGSAYTKVTIGLETLGRLEERLLTVGLEAELLTQKEYDEAQDVYDINSLKKVDGVFVVDEERIKDDPNYLVEVIKKQLEEQQRFTNSSGVMP